MKEEKIESEKPRINARCGGTKIKKKARWWRKEEKQGNIEIPRKRKFMEVKRGGKEKKHRKTKKKRGYGGKKTKIQKHQEKARRWKKVTEKQMED